MKQANQGQVYETSKKERFSYGIYFFGQLTVYVIVLSYLQIFLTDIGIPATAVAVIFLVAKIWDAVNDPLFGLIVNRVSFKKGKYKPWLKISAFIIPVCTAALFAIPAGLSTGLKIVLASVLYIAWDLSYTLCDIPVFSVVTTMTNNIRERTSIIAQGRVLMFVGALVTGILTPILYPAAGWFKAAAVLSLAALATMVPLGYAARERHQPPGGAENPSIKELILAVGQNKYLLLMVISFIIANMTNTGVAVGGYFAIYCLGGPQIMSLLSLLGTIPVMALSALIPALTKKIDKFTLLLIVTGGAIILSVLLFLAGYASMPVFLVINTLRGLCVALPGTLMPMFILDCAEYGLYKTRKNSTALSVALQTFSAKVYGALAGAIGMFILGLSGFVSGAGAVQPPGAIRAIWLLFSIAPVSGLLIAFLMLLAGYKLRDRDIQLMARVNQGELNREEAEKLLSPAITR
jgi:sugar (glycoside-pentoside-hexuronide) transporter